MQRARGVIGRERIVRHHDDGLALLAVQHLQQSQDFFGVLAVKIAGGFVAHEQRRVGHECARDGYALLLSAGQFARLVRGAVGESDQLEHGAHILLALRRGQVGQQQRYFDIARRAQHRQQVVELKDKSDVAGAPFGELAAGQAIDALAGHRAPRPRWADPGRRSD